MVIVLLEIVVTQEISIDERLSVRIAFKLLLSYNLDRGVIIMGELSKIPYVGKATEASLKLIGYETISSLKGADPQKMYQKECKIRGQSVDRCQLYMYRMIVYYANTLNPDPNKLKWWVWKD